MARFDPRPAALALLEAFRDGEPISALPEGAAPATAAQATRVAHALINGLGLPVVGFRCLADGTTGPLLAPRIVPAGTTVPLAALPGLQASAACFFPLIRPLPPADEPYTSRRVLAALGPGRAAIDLAAWRTRDRPVAQAARIADLAGLGMVVVARPSRAAARIDPGAILIACGNGRPARLDATPALLAAAEAARAVGGLPQGAALVAAGLMPLAASAAGAILTVRAVRGGTATVTLA